jgi:hypothetical protein
MDYDPMVMDEAVGPSVKITEVNPPSALPCPSM